VKARVEEGHVVWTVYESCGFGYTLDCKLKEVGAHNLVISPMRLDTQRRRKTDKLDARQLCGRLTRYLEGQKNELAVIRVPSRTEQERRETGRQRLFWRSQVQRLSSHGQALRLEHEHEDLPGRWWTARNWKKLAPAITPYVRQMLELLRPQLEIADREFKALTREIQSSVTEPLPDGLGQLTMSLYDREVCDAGRFGNRKQVGSYIGCCPSVYSSGSTMHLGSIDRHGNRHLRALLVEAVWRLVRFQPGWLAYRRVRARMKAGGAIGKKLAVALARQLAIDLWRVRTGRATWEQLGFKIK
jgi:transposase